MRSVLRTKSSSRCFTMACEAWVSRVCKSPRSPWVLPWQRSRQSISVEPQTSMCHHQRSSVGDAAFARAFESLSGVESPPASRVIHHTDPVARIGWRNIGFRDVGREVYNSTGNSASFRVCSAKTSEDATRASSVSLWACLFSPNLVDHLAYLNVTFWGRTFPSGCMTHSNAKPVLV